MKANSLEAAMREALATQGMQQQPPAQQAAAPHDLGGVLRAPADPQGYLIPVPAPLERDGELEAKARQWFHAAGLPQGAVSGIVQAYCRHLCGESQDVEVRARSTEAELAREWGADYPRKIAAAQALIEKCGGAEEIGELLSGTGLGNDAWLIRTLAAIAEMEPAEGAGR